MTTGTEPSEVERLKQELDQEHQMHMRALADFENYRRRMERDRETAALQSRRGIILPLLELLDGFERALPHLRDEPSAEGIRAIHRQLLGLLDAQGVTPFNSLGEEFNPELHEALGSEPSEQHRPGTITEEVRRGYRWHNDLLRPALVRVAQ
jgi:molecular chaperone GrpE